MNFKEIRKSIGLSQKAIAQILGCTQQYICYIEKVNKDIEDDHLAKLMEYFSDDAGRMLILSRKREQKNGTNIYNSPYSAVNSPNASISHIEGDQPQDVQADEVPLVPASIQKVRDVDVLHYVQNNDVTQLPEIKQFPSFDMYYEVTGESMMPNLMPADRLGLRRVERELPILNGHTYVIDTSSLGIFVCNLYDNGDEFQCRFNNTERFGEVVIPKRDVINVFEVVGMYRLNV